jgi:hypothetical protein
MTIIARFHKTVASEAYKSRDVLRIPAYALAAKGAAQSRRTPDIRPSFEAVMSGATASVNGQEKT